MKKILAVITIFIHTAAISQVHIGAKAGAGLSRIEGKAFQEKFELGYHLGGFMYANLSDFTGFQAEVVFNQTNTSVQDSYSDVVDNAFKGKKTLNYISVPLLLRLNSDGFITFTGGPQLSFLADSDKSVTENGKKIFKKTDFALLAGAEINLHPFIFYGRYCWGFTDISEIGRSSNSRQIQLGAAIRLF